MIAFCSLISALSLIFLVGAFCWFSVKGFFKGADGKPGTIIVFVNNPEQEIHYKGQTDTLPTEDMQVGDAYLFNGLIAFWTSNGWNFETLNQVK